MMVSQDAQRSLPLWLSVLSAVSHRKRVLLCAEMASERFPEISVGKIVNFRMF